MKFFKNIIKRWVKWDIERAIRKDFPLTKKLKYEFLKERLYFDEILDTNGDWKKTDNDSLSNMYYRKLSYSDCNYDYYILQGAVFNTDFIVRKKK